MNPDAIPEHSKRIIQDKKLSYHQKMVAFMAHMPGLPGSGNDADLQANIEIGRKIKSLIDDGKIQLEVDKDFKIKAVDKWEMIDEN